MEGATLEDAIYYNQEALYTCRENDPLYSKIQNNLGSIYLTQFNKSGAEGDLVKAVEAFEDGHCTYYYRVLQDVKRAKPGPKGRRDKLSVLTRHKSTWRSLLVLIPHLTVASLWQVVGVRSIPQMKVAHRGLPPSLSLQTSQPFLS